MYMTSRNPCWTQRRQRRSACVAVHGLRRKVITSAAHSICIGVVADELNRGMIRSCEWNIVELPIRGATRDRTRPTT